MLSPLIRFLYDAATPGPKIVQIGQAAEVDSSGIVSPAEMTAPAVLPGGGYREVIPKSTIVLEREALVFSVPGIPSMTRFGVVEVWFTALDQEAEGVLALIDYLEDDDGDPASLVRFIEATERSEHHGPK